MTGDRDIGDYFNSFLHTINESISNLNISAFNELVNDALFALRNGRRIVASGLGKNVPVCEKFVGTMVSLGLDAAFLHTNTAVHGDMGIVGDGDVVIILSKSGETAESLYLCEKLRNRECLIWALTFTENSNLVKMADKAMVLEMDHEGDAWNIVPNNSTTLNLIVLQGLAIIVAERMGVTLDDFRKNHPGGHIGVQLSK